ncbi:hypothetical protein [Desulfosudis oleivorans]|nr:hypothetical protein [Desulfosudis oleivorans]
MVLVLVTGLTLGCSSELEKKVAAQKALQSTLQKQENELREVLNQHREAEEMQAEADRLASQADSRKADNSHLRYDARY